MVSNSNELSATAAAVVKVRGHISVPKFLKMKYSRAKMNSN